MSNIENLNNYKASIQSEIEKLQANFTTKKVKVEQLYQSYIDEASLLDKISTKINSLQDELTALNQYSTWKETAPEISPVTVRAIKEKEYKANVTIVGKPSWLEGGGNVKLTRTVTGNEATGTITRITGFTGYSDTPELQEGAYVTFIFEVDTDTYNKVVLVETADGTAQLLNVEVDGSPTETTTATDLLAKLKAEGEGYILTLITRVADSITEPPKNVTFKFDWDGSGDTFVERVVSIDMTKVDVVD